MGRPAGSPCALSLLLTENLLSSQSHETLLPGNEVEEASIEPLSLVLDLVFKMSVGTLQGLAALSRVP